MGFGAGPLEYRADESPLVVGGILKAGREGLLPLPDELARDRMLPEHQVVRHADDGRRIQSPTQAGADGHIASEAKSDRVAEEVPEALGRVPHREAGLATRGKIPVPLHRDLRIHRQGMRGRELPDALEEGVLGMIKAGPVEVVEDRALVRRGPEAGRQQAFDLGGEGESRTVPGIVERLHPHAVPRAEEPAPISVPDGKREHPVEARDAGLAPLPVGCEQDLGVGR